MLGCDEGVDGVDDAGVETGAGVDGAAAGAEAGGVTVAVDMVLLWEGARQGVAQLLCGKSAS